MAKSRAKAQVLEKEMCLSASKAMGVTGPRVFQSGRFSHAEAYVQAAGFEPAAALEGQSLVPLVMNTGGDGGPSSAGAVARTVAVAPGSASPPHTGLNYSFSQIEHGLLMGLSLRMDGFRYTEWLTFDKKSELDISLDSDTENAKEGRVQGASRTPTS